MDLTFEEITTALNDLYDGEPDADVDPNKLWDSLDSEIQWEIEGYLS